MGQPDLAYVDVAALAGVARAYRSTADDVDAVVRSRLATLAFDGATAGRSHMARGDALRLAVDGVVDRLRAWSRASAEISDMLVMSADRYAVADLRARDRLGG